MHNLVYYWWWIKYEPLKKPISNGKRTVNGNDLTLKLLYLDFFLFKICISLIYDSDSQYAIYIYYRK